MIIFLSSPDGSQYPFGLVFRPKDMAYSVREVVLKNYRYAPKKTPAFRPVFLCHLCQSFILWQRF